MASAQQQPGSVRSWMAIEAILYAIQSTVKYFQTADVARMNDVVQLIYQLP